jgi:hypothetical protein
MWDFIWRSVFVRLEIKHSTKVITFNMMKGPNTGLRELVQLNITERNGVKVPTLSH